jgi:hypothetical protein
VPKNMPRTDGKAAPVDRARARLRAQRYSTWKELHGAVLEWCRGEIGRQNPSYDVPGLEQQARGWARGEDDEGRRHWRAVRDAVVDATNYLDSHPEAPSRSSYAAMLMGFLSAPCLGADGDYGHSVRERLASWGRRSRDDHKQEALSFRTRLVATFCWGPNLLWWGDRLPTIRDLAILCLLAGQVPEGVKKRQSAATTPAERPTVGDVVAAEQEAVREVLRKRSRPRSPPRP